MFGKRVAELRWIGLAAAISALAIILPASPTRSDGLLDWIVSSISGPSVEEVSFGGLLEGDAVELDRVIVTGPDSSLVLRHGKDTITMMPNSAVTIDGTDALSGQTRIFLHRGTVQAKVAKRRQDETFSVQTRYLAAVVKGTQFEVSVNDNAAAVSVSEGRVAVGTKASGKSVDVTPGKTATVSRGGAPEVGNTPTGGAPAAAESAGQLASAANASPQATVAAGGPSASDGSDVGNSGAKNGAGAGKANGKNANASKGKGNGKDKDTNKGKNKDKDKE